MTILHISDTHGLHHRLGVLPSADVLVHSGDFTHSGTESEVLDFLNWFIALPYSHKFFVAGNHDLCLWDAEAIDDLPRNPTIINQFRYARLSENAGYGIDKIA